MSAMEPHTPADIAGARRFAAQRISGALACASESLE